MQIKWNLKIIDDKDIATTEKDIYAKEPSTGIPSGYPVYVIRIPDDSDIGYTCLFIPLNKEKWDVNTLLEMEELSFKDAKEGNYTVSEGHILLTRDGRSGMYILKDED